MHRVNVDELFEGKQSKYALAVGVAKRARQITKTFEESPNAKGLGVFDGTIKKIPSGDGLKIPHIGWNSLEIKKENGLFKGIDKNSYVYFVHSYFLDAKDKKIVSAKTEYGVKIDAAIEKDNVFATQFHPEKSGETGLKILKNFADIVNG